MNTLSSEGGVPIFRRLGETPSVTLGGFGVDWKIDGGDTDGRFAVVHHSIAPHTLAAPLHLHHCEDEYSYVLEGTMTAMLGPDIVRAEAGTWVFKPRRQWHTFWNESDAPCQIIEVISPAGFENYFHELVESKGALGEIQRIAQTYSLDIDPESIPRLCGQFGLQLG